MSALPQTVKNRIEVIASRFADANTFFNVKARLFSSLADALLVGFGMLCSELSCCLFDNYVAPLLRPKQTVDPEEDHGREATKDDQEFFLKAPWLAVGFIDVLICCQVTQKSIKQ